MTECEKLDDTSADLRNLFNPNPDPDSATTPMVREILDVFMRHKATYNQVVRALKRVERRIGSILICPDVFVGGPHMGLGLIVMFFKCFYCG